MAIVTALTVAGYSKGIAGSVAVLDRLITYWSVILVGAIVAVIMMKLRAAGSQSAGSIKDTVQSTSS